MYVYTQLLYNAGAIVSESFSVNDPCLGRGVYVGDSVD